MRAPTADLAEQFSSKNQRTSIDGHVLHSGWEAVVDNWFFDHAIAHHLHPALHFGPGRGFEADFLVADTYVEVWGVTRNAQYNQRRLAKLNAYATHGLRVIEVWSHDLEQGNYSALHVLLPTPSK